MCAGMGSFVPPGASSFLSSLKESYQRKPLETTFQDFLGAGMCRCCACGRRMGRFVPRHEYLSFFVKRKVPKKTTQTYGLRIPWRGEGFAAAAASWLSPGGEAASGGHISFCEERNVGKKVA